MKFDGVVVFFDIIKKEYIDFFMDVFRKFVDLKEIIYIIVYYIELDYSGVCLKFLRRMVIGFR